MPQTKSIRYRLVLLSMVVGIFGAIAALGFDALVDFAQEHLLGRLGGYQPPAVGSLDPSHVVPQGMARLWLPVVTTLGGLLSGFIVFRWAPEAAGHGTDAAISAYHEHGGEVRPRVVWIKAITSALTIGSGGVAGREGPTAQISVGLATLFARFTKIRGVERRTLLLAGMAAGLAAIFRAPLGMAIFAVEILYSGMVFESEALIYTVIAAVTAYAFYGVFGGWEPLFEIPPGLRFDDPSALLGFALLGVLAGLIGAVLPSLLYRTQALFARLPGPPHIRPAVGGLLVGLIAMAAPEVLGTGYGWVELAMSGHLALTTVLLILLLKGPCMAITIGSGGSGGVFAPTVTLGAMLGAAVAFIPGLGLGADVPAAAFVVVGMAAVFSGVARTPISTLIMVAEMTGGYGLIVPAMLANILAFVVQRALTLGRRYPTLYLSQVETREQSPLHQGLFVRRALEMLEGGALPSSEIRLPHLVSLLRHGQPIAVGQGEDGAMLTTLEIAPGSSLDGATVAHGIGTIPQATAVAVLRGEKMISPRGDTRLAAGDHLLTVASAEAHAALTKAAGVDG